MVKQKNKNTKKPKEQGFICDNCHISLSRTPVARVIIRNEGERKFCEEGCYKEFLEKELEEVEEEKLDRFLDYPETEKFIECLATRSDFVEILDAIAEITGNSRDLARGSKVKDEQTTNHG